MKTFSESNPTGAMAGDGLLQLAPVPTLLKRVREELSAEFDPTQPMRISRAPGRLDVMGGIADYTGSLVAEATLDCAAAVALQPRVDRQVQIFSFNLLDEHQPFTFRIPLDALATQPLEVLKREFSEPGRLWASYLAGCLFMLHESRVIDLADPRHQGMNLALYSTIPMGAGVSSSAAIEVATMMNLVDHFNVRDRFLPMTLASLCQQVENRVVGAPCGVMDQVSCCYGETGSLLQMICQPHEMQPALHFPVGAGVVGINSRVRHSVGGGAYGQTRCAAFMGHKIILHKMGEIGAASGQELISDPMNGYLANLDPDHYKQLFRPHVPEVMRGQDFLDHFGATIDTTTSVQPDVQYQIQHATDHHVLEARRVRRFSEFLTKAHDASGSARKLLLDKAGHLMYASHLSYTNDAMLGADECDLLVQLVRQCEASGLYGAKITGGGSGGTVAVLVEETEAALDAVAQIMDEYRKQTGITAELFAGSSPGAWHVGSVLI